MPDAEVDKESAERESAALEVGVVPSLLDGMISKWNGEIR